MEYLSGICPDIEQAGTDECYMDYTPISGSYSSLRKAAVFRKDTVCEKFGFTVNVGISGRICKRACTLFDELWHGVPIHLLGVRTTRPVPEAEPVQLSLFDDTTPISEKQKKPDAAPDRVRNRCGGSLRRHIFLPPQCDPRGAFLLYGTNFPIE